MAVKFILIFLSSIDLLHCFSDEIIPNLLLGISSSDNSTCVKENRLILEERDKFSLWAYQAWDASARSTIGILEGKTYQMGNFDECMSIAGPFSMQYCLVSISITVPKDFPARNDKTLIFNGLKDRTKAQSLTTYIGLCLPASCSNSQLENYTNDYLSTFKPSFAKEAISYTSKYLPHLCQRQNESTNRTPAIAIFCVIVAILISLVVGATTYDLKTSKPTDAVFTKLLLTFSLRTNLAVLMEKYSGNASFNTIPGIKVFAMIGIVVGHRIVFTIAGPLANPGAVWEAVPFWLMGIFLRADLLADSFFTVAGVLAAYGLLTYYEKNPFNPPALMVARLIRLTPVLAIVILYFVSVFPYTGSGPLWKGFVKAYTETCESNWWTNFLYIQTFINEQNLCLIYSWYLAGDFNYFYMATLLMFAITKRPKIGFSLLGVVTVVSLVTPFVTIMKNQFTATDTIVDDLIDYLINKNERFLKFYIQVHTRMAPYMIGLIAGCYYHRLNAKNEKLSQINSSLLVSASASLLLAPMISSVAFLTPDYEYNVVAAAAYATFDRFSWALGTVGLLFACSHGHARMLRTLLSWHFFVPLSKLTYCVYLVHMVFTSQSAGSRRNPLHFSLWNTFSMALTDLALSYGVSLIVYLTVETPFRLLAKEIKKIRSQDYQQPPDQLDNTKL